MPVTRAVDEVFARALAVRPADRYRTLGIFWSALHHALFPDAPAWTAGSTSGGGGVASGPLPQPAGVIAPQTRSEAPTGVPPSPRRSRKGAIGAVLAATVVAFGGGAVAHRALRDRASVQSLTNAVPDLGPVVADVGTRRPGECPEGMVVVPGGRFFMGSDDAAFKLWQPAHKVALDAFCIDVNEVTVAAYQACVAAKACAPPDDVPDYPKPSGASDEEHDKTRRAYAELCNYGKSGRDQHPINCVSWYGAEKYCAWHDGRLPTEAEWEYAARGSDGRTFPWGDEAGGPQFMNACGVECNRWEKEHALAASERMYEFDDGFAGTAPVGSFPKGKTRFGAYDVVGNVWEWTSDWFETYKPGEVVNPKGAPAGDRKAIRGGGFNGGVVLWHNPAFRYHQLATATSHGIGFRCAADLVPARGSRPAPTPR
jgi:formylglycine-generating enzyme required for sulfatase activity